MRHLNYQRPRRRLIVTLLLGVAISSVIGFSAPTIFAAGQTHGITARHIKSYESSQNESSPFTPIISPNGSGSYLYLAWTGADLSHHLNLMASSDGQNWGSHVIMTDTAAGTPGFTMFQGYPYFAWQGTGNHPNGYLGYYDSGISCNGYCPLQNHTAFDGQGNDPQFIDASGGITLAVYAKALFIGWRDKTSSIWYTYTTDGKTYLKNQDVGPNSSMCGGGAPAFAVLNGNLYLGANVPGGGEGCGASTGVSELCFNNSLSSCGSSNVAASLGIGPLGDVGLTANSSELFFTYATNAIPSGVNCYGATSVRLEYDWSGTSNDNGSLAFCDPVSVRSGLSLTYFKGTRLVAYANPNESIVVRTDRVI